MSLFRSRLPTISFEPCLPSVAKTPPTGPDWIHEIKHDGFRVMAKRNGKDLTYRFPLVVQVVAALPVHSCFIDGEAIISDATGWPFSACSEVIATDRVRRCVHSIFSRSMVRTCVGDRLRTARVCSSS
jgi:ATP-dependent DNA ligase